VRQDMKAAQRADVAKAAAAATPKPLTFWEQYRKIVAASGEKFSDFEYVERFAFYERARKAYAVVATSEKALYANVILKKGVL